MSKMKSMSMVIGWSLFWIALAGADRGCFGTLPCEELDEQACLADEDCRPVYLDSLAYDGEANLRCLGDDGLRCLPEEPIFDHCEQKPDCAALDEQGCLAESSCQAVYGYDYSQYADGMTPRCAPGTRCLEPELVYIECLDADADPCSGLDEAECNRRPVCEPLYSPGGCDDEKCWDGYSYEGCQRAGDQCRSDADCYAVYGPEGAPEPGCQNWWLSCEGGVCVEHCEDSGCQDDSDCAAGERCEIYCGNGWCRGECVPDEDDCRVSGCPEGFVCQEICYDWCDQTVPDPECCSSSCVAEEYECQVDADCGPGSFCEPLPNVDCYPGAPCPGTCRAGVWMEFLPVLCPAPPWQEDEQQHPENYWGCYGDCAPGVPCAEDSNTEICRVRTFLLLQGILAHDIRDVQGEVVYCATCWQCPRGDTIYVLAAPEDVELLLELGFEYYQG